MFKKIHDLILDSRRDQIRQRRLPKDCWPRPWACRLWQIREVHQNQKESKLQTQPNQQTNDAKVEHQMKKKSQSLVL